MSAAVISLENASVYQSENLIINQIGIKIAKGEFVYLIGKTGAGKSSFLKLLYGEIPLQHGQGNVCGVDLTSLKWKSLPGLRRKLGIVFQDFNLLDDRSVESNLQFVLNATGWKDKSKIDHRINEVLGYVKLTEKKTKMPHELSGGEQQRIVIARALLNTPELIIADEPTGNLDPETSEEILLLLRHLSSQHGFAVLMATHDYALIEKFPARTLRCMDQKIVESERIEM